MENNKTVRTKTNVERFAVLTVTKEFTVHAPYAKPEVIPVGTVKEVSLRSFNPDGDYVVNCGHGLDYSWPADCFDRQDFEEITEKTTTVEIHVTRNPL
jgi:hypothetical protein